MDTIKFEWDENKNQTNQKKHGISFEEAKEVFFDDDAILFDDPEHSKGEERFLIIGLIQKEKNMHRKPLLQRQRKHDQNHFSTKSNQKRKENIHR